MSEDRRAQILDRLMAIYTPIPEALGFPANSVFRNRGELPEDKRPAIVLLDGLEVRASSLRAGRTMMGPQIMTLQPQTFVLLKPRKTAANSGIGAELTLFRNRIIRDVSKDEFLATLCGPNGQIVLNRVETDLQTGSSLSGEMRIDFAIDYVLTPNAL